MDTIQHRDAQAACSMGLHCVKATATLPATTTQTIFTVTGGNILVTLLLGEVTTVFQNSDPVLTVVVNPTAAGTNTTIASTADTTSLEAGGFLFVEGDGSALVKANAGSVAVTGQHEFIVAPGAIILNSGATKSGATKWDLWYFPLEEGAKVVSG